MARLALLIGVSEYGSGLNPLPGSVMDVDAMQRVLGHPEMGGFAATDITVLKDPQPQTMQEAIYELFNNRQKDDLLLFYFSGHGIKDEYNNLYLGTSATWLENGKLYEPSALAASYLHQRINQSRSQHQVLILDCCFSGAIAQGMTVKDDGIVNLENYLGGKGRAILTSSTATEYSFAVEATEPENSGLSIYTRYLVEGIGTGAADLDDDGWIAVEELHEYASKRVKEAAPAMNPKFYPVEEGYKIILAKSPKDDPKLKYRKEVEKRAELSSGKLSIPAQRLLERQRIDWGITAAEAEAIRDQVLQPYREYAAKLREYEEALTEAVKLEFPFSPGAEADLKDYQKYLKLRDPDILEIEQRVLNPLGREHQRQANRQVESEDRDRNSPTKIQFTSVKLNVKGEIIEQPQGEAEILTENLGNGVSLTMVKIPAGQFLMGSPPSEADRSNDESPQHKVRVPEFYLGQTLVTQEQWQQIMGNNPSRFTGNGKLPVEQVSWLDAQEFCQKLSQYTQRKYRLPSEAEWEYACRAGTTTPFHFGETITTDVANFNGNYTYRNAPEGKYLEKTTPVGFYKVANNFGLYDMHGNVWEWCEDTWHENYQGAPTDGSAWIDNDNHSHLLRGGSWDFSPWYCRSAVRGRWSAGYGDVSFGFRVVFPQNS